MILKKITGKLLLVISSLAFMLQACSKGGSSGGTTPNKTLTVTLAKSQIRGDNWETTAVTVIDQNNNDVTSTSTIYLGNLALPAKLVFASTPGNYKVKATRSGATSSEADLTVTDPGLSPFSQKVLVEDYTGTWCGHCPRIGINLESYVSNRPKTIVVANHGPSDDPYTFSNHSVLANTFGVTGYPFAVLDRDKKWNESNGQLDDQFTNRRAPLGLSFQTSVSGNTINGTVNVKFDVTTDVTLRLVLYLVEDGKVYPQVNYGYFSMPNPIANYVHNGILRKTITDLYGDNISLADQAKGTTYSKAFSVDATGYDISKCRIIGFVVQGANNHGRKERAVLNVQSVKAGLSKDFD